MLVGTKAEVLNGLTGVLGPTEEQGVGTGRGAESKLVKSEALATGLLNTGTSSGGEAKSGDAQLGNLKHAVVVSDGTDNDDGLSLVGFGLVGGDCGVCKAGERDRWAVDLGHKEAAKDNLVEAALGTAWKRR